VIVSLDLPYPLTTNTMFTVARGRKIKSARYRVWSEEAARMVVAQMAGQKPVVGPFHIIIELDRPDNRARDLDNGAKCLLDALVQGQVIHDDSEALSILLKWSDRKPGRDALAHIEIRTA
jgi:crossover junction endodeoxyribonuclease RusA